FLLICSCYLFFFFFQAEDGIRDDLVTGVQTCALPICMAYRQVLSASRFESQAVGFVGGLRPWHGVDALPGLLSRLIERHATLRQIGRASCRERVEISGEAG